jgi:hypothetical protein
LLPEPRRLPIVFILTWYVTRSPQFFGAILECSEMINTDGIIYGDMFLTRISTTTGGVRQSVGEAAAEGGGQT